MYKPDVIRWRKAFRCLEPIKIVCNTCRTPANILPCNTCYDIKTPISVLPCKDSSICFFNHQKHLCSKSSRLNDFLICLNDHLSRLRVYLNRKSAEFFLYKDGSYPTQLELNWPSTIDVEGADWIERQFNNDFQSSNERKNQIDKTNKNHFAILISILALAGYVYNNLPNSIWDYSDWFLFLSIGYWIAGLIAWLAAIGWLLASFQIRKTSYGIDSRQIVQGLIRYGNSEKTQERSKEIMHESLVSAIAYSAHINRIVNEARAHNTNIVRHYIIVCSALMLISIALFLFHELYGFSQ